MRTGAWDPGVNGGTHHAHGGGGRTGRTSDPVFGPIFVFFGILSAGGGSTSSYRCRQRGGICCPVLISEYRRLNSPETAVGGVCHSTQVSQERTEQPVPALTRTACSPAHSLSWSGPRTVE